ncbi:MAG: metallophosphoesterase family protein [Acidimicrobiia bacterium]
MTTAQHVHTIPILERLFPETGQAGSRVPQPKVQHLELIGIADDHAVLTFRTQRFDCAEVQVINKTNGRAFRSQQSYGRTSEIDPQHQYHFVRVDDLEPQTEYVVRVLAPGGMQHLAACKLRTLARVSGTVVARIATVNDLHFGEPETGRLREIERIPLVVRIPGLRKIVTPIRHPDGHSSYPAMMNAGAVSDIAQWQPDLVVAKGDLTHSGRPEHLDAFRSTYAPFENRLLAFRGNHDAAAEKILPGRDLTVALPGVTVAVVDTVDPGHTRGRIREHQIEWLRSVAAAATTPVLVFGHHNLFTRRAGVGPHGSFFYGVNPEDTYRMLRVLDECPAIAGYFSGHSHRNRVTFGPRGVPIVETASVKEFPATWAAYTVREGGLMQTQYPISSPDALAWSAMTRSMYAGLAPRFARGRATDRALAIPFTPLRDIREAGSGPSS